MASTQRWTTVLASTATFTVVADSFGLISALPAIDNAYDASPTAVRWVAVAHLLALAVLLPAGSRLADRFGHRGTLSLGFLVFAAGSAACAAAPSLGWLVAARAVQGAGSALALAAARGLFRAAFPIGGRAWIPERVWPGAALVLGPLAVGALAAGPGWRWDFAAEAVVGVVAAVLARVLTAEFHGARRSLGLESLAVTGLGVSGVAWAVHRSTSGWSADAIAALVVGCAALVLVVRWETPLGGLHARAFLASNAASLFLAASISGSAFIVVWSLHTAGGLRPVGIALRLMVWALVTGLVSELLVAPRRWGDLSRPRMRRVAAWGLLLHAVGLGVLALVAEHGVGRAVALVPIVLSGAGAGMAVAGRGLGFPESLGVRRPSPTVDEESPSTITGVACAGGALGTALMAGLSTGRPGGAGWPGAHGAMAALVWGALLAAAGFAASLAMPVGPAGGAAGMGRNRRPGPRMASPEDWPPPNTAARSAGELGDTVPGAPPHAAFS
jgi:MFS family permease